MTVLDPSAAMLGKAAARREAEPAEVRARVRLVEAPGESAAEATGGQLFDAVLCHGVLMYVEDPGPLVAQLARCLAAGGLVSIMALNARALAVRPAVDGRWADALAAFDASTETGVLGTATRADTVEGLSAMLRIDGVEPVAWYGVWLFTDWTEVALDGTDVESVAAVELEASRRDPYRGLSRVFHLVGRRVP